MTVSIKTVKIEWTWGEEQGGDLSSIKGFTVALAPQNANPDTEAVQVGVAGKDERSFTFHNIPLADEIYTAWVHAMYIGKDSSWVSSGDITIPDNGVAVITNADLTVDDIKMGASWSTLPEDGADVTGNNTSNDTNNVNGTPAEIVQNNADAAITAANNQSSDGIFSVQEKAAWRVQYPAMYQNYINIIQQATDYGILSDPAITNFNAAATALNEYLYITQDIFAVNPVDTPIVNNELSTYTKDFYDKQQIAVNKITDYVTTAHGVADYADVTANSTFVNNVYPADQQVLKIQIDGKVESWFQSSDPSSSWETPNALHYGDMWWNTGTNQLKRYNGSSWSAPLVDQKAIDAYDNASFAQSTADGKAVVFTTQPYNYDVGDLWDAGGNPRILKRAVNAHSSYRASDWVTLANETTNTNQLTDGAALGSTANWSFVRDDDGEKPENGANKITNTNQLIDSAGLGDTADWNKVSGAGKPEDGADVTGNNTSNDTNNVNGLQSNAISGWAHVNDPFKIDGGKVFANSITSNQIASYTVSADNMAANSINAQNGAIADLTVDTIKIKDNAVTIPIGTYQYNWYAQATITLDDDYPVIIMGTVVQSYYAEIRLYRDSTILWSEIPIAGTLASKNVIDRPGAGTYTYSFGSMDQRNKNGTSLVLLVAKK